MNQPNKINITARSYPSIILHFSIFFRMALQNSSYITNVIGIKNYVHRQKIQLKALDLVLFGFHDSTSRLKDYALALLLVILISVLILFKNQQHRARRQMEELSSKLSDLQSMESDFEGAQKK